MRLTGQPLPAAPTLRRQDDAANDDGRRQLADRERALAEAADAADASAADASSGELMTIQTTRFGAVEVEADLLIDMPLGMLGFPASRRFTLIRPDTEAGEDSGGAASAGAFLWLQSCDEPGVAFIVTDPTAYFPGYEVPLRDESLDDLGIDGEPAAGQVAVLVTVNRAPDDKGGADWLTGNLMGPVLVNAANRRAKQVVLTEKRWTTRQPLIRLAAPAAPAAPAATPAGAAA